MPPLKTSRIQIVCRACKAPYWTQVRGRSTKCPSCQTSRYVLQAQAWEGPVTTDTQRDHDRSARVAARLPVWCACGCSHLWQSRAADLQRLRCPSCGAGIRVPRRTHDNTRAVPPGAYRPRPPKRVTTREKPEPERTPWAPNLRPPAALWGALARPAAPTPPAPRPAPLPAAFRPEPSRPAPARPASVTPSVDAQKDRQRRDIVCMLVRSLGGALMVWWDGCAPGACEVQDTSQRREDQRCPADASRAVVFRSYSEEATAYACPAHAVALASMADWTDSISATVYGARF